MSDENPTMNLTGKLLIAMPGMGDPRFEKSVIFMCDHSEKGAMGMIVNKPLPGTQIDDVMARLDIPIVVSSRDTEVHFGGPVENGRGFVLHSADYLIDDVTLKVDETFGMTATKDVLEAIANGSGPDDAILMLGYAGWAPGQLEAEIAQNGWLISDASSELVFATKASSKWGAALNSLGIDPLLLSPTSGRA